MASKGRMGIQEPVMSKLNCVVSVSMASKGRMGIQDRHRKHAGRPGQRFQWPAKAGWGFREYLGYGVTTPRSFQWPAKAGWGFRDGDGVLDPVDNCRFNGQQRPDGDSGRH